VSDEKQTEQVTVQFSDGQGLHAEQVTSLVVSDKGAYGNGHLGSAFADDGISTGTVGGGGSGGQ
jgi:hypothetical protein